MKKTIKLVPLIPEFDKFIRASKTGRRRKPDGSKFSAGTLEAYKNCRKVLARFSDKFGDFQIYSGFSVNKAIFRARTKYWVQSFYDFTDFLRKSKYSESYIRHNLKIIKAVLHYVGQQYGWPDAGFPSVKMGKLQQPDPLVLSVTQVQELVNARFGDSFHERRLSAIRDIVVIGCLTALRYGDLMNIRRESIISKDGKCWLDIQSQKTATQTKVLLPEFGQKILERHTALADLFGSTLDFLVTGDIESKAQASLKDTELINQFKTLAAEGRKSTSAKNDHSLRERF